MMKAGPSVLRSVAITVAMRWTDRLIALVSTIILARLLVPEDFGIVVQAYIVLGLTATILDLGVNLALIQNRDATPDHYNTAWTMRIGQALCVALALFVAAPFAGDYFREPRVVAVIQALAAVTVIASVENIGIITFQKEMRFELDFKFLLLRRLCSFVATIALALALRSYWALVAGTLVGAVAGVALSYRMHGMRPRLSVSRLRELFAFAQWAVVREIGNYLTLTLDRLFLGGRSSTETMGAYSVANDVASMPTGELLAPLYRVLFPAFVQAKERPEELKRLYLLAQGLQAMLVFPVCAGIALVAYEIVLLLLGVNWLLAVPFLQVLALVQLGNTLLNGSGYILITMGQVRNSAAIAWTQVLSLAVGALIVFPHAEGLDIAWLRVASVMCAVLVATWMVRGVLPGLRNKDVVDNIWRPGFGVVAMIVVLLTLAQMMQVTPLPALLLKVFVGAAVYTLTVLALWMVSGRPTGAETYAMEKTAMLWARLRRASSGGAA